MGLSVPRRSQDEGEVASFRPVFLFLSLSFSSLSFRVSGFTTFHFDICIRGLQYSYYLGVHGKGDIVYSTDTTAEA